MDGDLVSKFRHSVDYPVYSIAVTDSVIYIGGDFTSVDNTHIRKGLAGFSKKNGALLSWDPNARLVRSMVVSPSRHTLYIGGYFKTVSEKNSAYYLTGLNNPTDITLPVEEFRENISQTDIVYPNPAQDFISIKPLEQNSLHTIEIYSLLGEKVLSKVEIIGTGENFKCNIQSLQPGSYTCRIATPKQAKVTQFVILR